MQFCVHVKLLLLFCVHASLIQIIMCFTWKLYGFELEDLSELCICRVSASALFSLMISTSYSELNVACNWKYIDWTVKVNMSLVDAKYTLMGCVNSVIVFSLLICTNILILMLIIWLLTGLYMIGVLPVRMFFCNNLAGHFDCHELRWLS